LAQAKKWLTESTKRAIDGDMISEQDLRKQIRWAAFEAGGQKVYAASIGVSAPALSLFLSGARKPSKGLLKAMGYEAVQERKYRRAGSQNG
jgi:DNA-binding transcriptional regulator YdaS (Cro superfamily)